jgi:hypothetical protein
VFLVGEEDVVERAGVEILIGRGYALVRAVESRSLDSMVL